MTKCDVVTGHFASMSSAEVDRLRANGSTVVGWHETAPTATREELWTGSAVRKTFLELLSARVFEDEHWSSEQPPRLLSERAAAIVKRTGRPVVQWLEFRRIYASFWRAALDSETDEQTVREMCLLTEELDVLSSDAKTEIKNQRQK